MTEYNKGDIVEPTAEFRENTQEGLDTHPELAGDGDRAVAAGDTFRVIGVVPTPLLGLEFVLAAPLDVDITDMSAEEFIADMDNPKYDDLILVLEDEIQGSNGVLAGV